MRLWPGLLLLIAAMTISACAGRRIAGVPVTLAKVAQLPFPEPPAMLTTPVARPAGGYLSTLPQPPHLPPTRQ